MLPRPLFAAVAAAISRLRIRHLSTASKFPSLSSKLPRAAPESEWKFWRNVTFMVMFPAILLGHVGAFLPRFRSAESDGEGGTAESAHHHHRPEFVPYPYLRLRTKKYPWGDGNHTFFHNAEVNALPDGYEDDNEKAKGWYWGETTVEDRK